MNAKPFTNKRNKTQSEILENLNVNVPTHSTFRILHYSGLQTQFLKKYSRIIVFVSSTSHVQKKCPYVQLSRKNKTSALYCLLVIV